MGFSLGPFLLCLSACFFKNSAVFLCNKIWLNIKFLLKLSAQVLEPCPTVSWH